MQRLSSSQKAQKYKANKRHEHNRISKHLSAKAAFVSEPEPVKLDFATLTTPHRPNLMKLAFKFTGREDAAEDLVQETYIRAFNFWPQFQPTTEDVSKDAQHWLRRILSNIFYTNCQREKRRAEAMEEYKFDSTLGENEDTDFIERTREMLSELSPELKEVLTLYYVEGHSYKEIAASLNMPVTKINKRLWRARNQLKELVKLAGFVNTKSKVNSSAEGDDSAILETT